MPNILFAGKDNSNNRIWGVMVAGDILDKKYITFWGYAGKIVNFRRRVYSYMRGVEVKQKIRIQERVYTSAIGSELMDWIIEEYEKEEMIKKLSC